MLCQSATCHEYVMSRKWLTDYPLSPRSGFELLAVKRESILPMISRWFAARSCKDQCEGMDKASRKLRKLILSIGRACLVKKQELYAMKFAPLAEFGDESIEVFLIFPRHITSAKIARSLGSRRELLIGT
ncbi:hypothetical protein F2Q70_00035522 [Brassica cretica]|uniref:Uncharacterized protein n=1 Tax=Brassica cretica TaxID=69181 RepID=A0A8S9K180_BRACR|nr:hypothetical protein F2Q70_00035522 [Brassica cretica]